MAGIQADLPISLPETIAVKKNSKWNPLFAGEAEFVQKEIKLNLRIR